MDAEIGRAAQARRFYLHVKDGGQLTADDVGLMVRTIEELETSASDMRDREMSTFVAGEIVALDLMKERDALAARLAKCAEIADDIFKKDEWTDHWQPDHAGGHNVRTKLKQIAALAKGEE